jgi:outer membrane protein assembly factor BamB
MLKIKPLSMALIVYQTRFAKEVAPMKLTSVWPSTGVFLLCLILGCSGQPSGPASTPAPESNAETRPADSTDPLKMPGEAEVAVETPDEAPMEPPAESPVEALAPSPPAAQPVRSPAPEPDGPYWPRFHGPRGDNLSSDTGLLKVWPEEGPPLDWTAEGIGNGYASVTLAHGLIYTVGNLDGKTVISALDLDGQLRWQVENGEAWTKDYAGTRGTPTIDGDRLYHQSPLGDLICIGAQTGEPVWAMNTLEAFEAENIEWALAESLLVDGDHLICCPGGKQASVAALNKTTGEIVWITESTGDKAGYGSPVLVEHGGLRIILTMTAKAVIGVHADTGRLLFRDPYETEFDVNVMMPLFRDGHVFVSTGYGGTGARMLKLNVQGEQVSVEHVWESKDLDNQHGGVMLVDGYLYGAADRFNNAKWICLDWRTGEMKWSDRTIGKGSLTWAEGLFYLFSERRQVALANLTPDAFELISEFRLPSGGSGATWAHPVVCGGRLYLRHDDRLFAYRVRADE